MGISFDRTPPVRRADLPAAPVTLKLILQRLQFAQLQQVGGPPASGDPITAVVGVDEQHTLSNATGLLVLGIGIETHAELARAWRRWSALSAAALVVRTDLVERCDVAAPETAIPLLGVGEDVPWMRLATLIANDLEAPGDAVGAHLDTMPEDNPEGLYAIANSLAALLRGPVTIEDNDSHILAFSADQDRADEHRKRSILERRVAQAHNEVLRSEGVFERLYGSPKPIFVVSSIAAARPRVAMRIRHAAHTLGSIWAVVDRPLTTTQEHGMIEASNATALSIMRRRLLDDAYRTERQRQLERLLSGGRDAALVANELRLVDSPLYVLALTTRTDASDVADEYAMRDLAKLLATFVTSVSRRAIVAHIGHTVYAVIPFPNAADHGCEHATTAGQFASNLLHRLAGHDLAVGIGDAVNDATQLSRSRQQADSAARVLTQDGRSATGLVGYWRDLQVDALLLETIDNLAARHEAIVGPLQELSRQADADQLATLRAYLDNFGDVSAAAAQVFVHPNTFRYRLRRICERADLDLREPDTRFALMFQLRLQDLQHRHRAHLHQ